MGTQITQKDLKQITEGIRNKYSKVADSPQGQFRYPDQVMMGGTLKSLKDRLSCWFQ